MKTLIRMAAFAAACCAMQPLARELSGLLKALGHAGDVKIEPTDYGNVFVWTPGNGGKPLTMRY